MLADCAEDIQFVNINDGKISIHLLGLEAFKQQATEACSYFSERQQTIESLSHQSSSASSEIASLSPAGLHRNN